MNSTAVDISTILAADTTLALTEATDLYISRFPDNPDECVLIVDNPGNPPLLTLSKSTSDYFNSSVNIQARAIDYTTAWDQLFAIIEFLHASSNIVEAGTYYALIRALGDPQLLHYDKNDRVVVHVNFEVQRRDN